MHTCPPHASWMSPHIRLLKSEIDGEGLYAIADIDEREPVLIWGGKGYTNYAGAMRVKEQGKIIMQWDVNIFSYDAESEDDAYYAVNHSCDPNIWMVDAFTLTARRNITSGEEITTDYALWETDENYISAWNCKCGTPLCRGRITGNDWKNLKLQQRYSGHFSPLINSRIVLRASEKKIYPKLKL